MTFQEKREAWLKSLQPGDEVYIENRDRYRTSRVARISPKGRITLENGEAFRSDGRQFSKPSSWDIRDTIVEPTQEIRDKLRKRWMVAQIEAFADRRGFGSMTLEQLDAVMAIIGKEGSGAGEN